MKQYINNLYYVQYRNNEILNIYFILYNNVLKKIVALIFSVKV